jgi:hypothetical protein
LALTSANFNFSHAGGKTFAEIMSNVTALWIRGEYISGTDQEGLDNVQIGVIPVPGAVWLLGSGLLGLAGWRKSRNI